MVPKQVLLHLDMWVGVLTECYQHLVQLENGSRTEVVPSEHKIPLLSSMVIIAATY